MKVFAILPIMSMLPEAVAQPAPSPAGQTAMIEEVRKQALAYVENLPNFICTQETHRYSANYKAPETWKLLDTLSIRLTYFGKKEDYQVVLVNGKPTDKSLRQLGGWKTTGDFGGILHSVFREKTGTRFEWLQWTTWSGRPAVVWKYRVDQERSPFQTTTRGAFRATTVTWAAGGLAYVDAETKQVMRVTVDSSGMPEKYPVREFHIDSEFGLQKIGDREYLLPARSVSVTVMEKERRKSESRFTDYRKFSADAEIKFGEAAK